MNALVYCERNNLYIRKPNGLEYTFEGVDAPALGFNFDVLVYDDIEVKIENWIDGKDFNQQTQLPLSPQEKDLIEQYIKNSEPPVGVSLQSQFAERLKNIEFEYISQTAEMYGFGDNFQYIIGAARDGSNHPLRSDARRVLEFFDAIGSVVVSLIDEIYATREDLIKPFEEYSKVIPTPHQVPVDR